MRERLRNSRGLRIGIVGVIFFAFLAGCIYLFFHNPVIYPIPCIFHVLTGDNGLDMGQVTLAGSFASKQNLLVAFALAEKSE